MNEIPEEELWRFSEKEIILMRTALNMLYRNLMKLKSANVISGASNDDVNIMLDLSGKLIDRVLLEEVCFDDYLTNYNNADEHEIYGVNPLDYEK